MFRLIGAGSDFDKRVFRVASVCVFAALTLGVPVILAAAETSVADSKTTEPTAATFAELAAVKPIKFAHAHNDYYHNRPLLDALSHGFCSVESDVFLVDGNLQVAHSRNELSPEKTLQKLYLEPLRKLVERNDGRVFRDGPTFTLMVDIKSEGTTTYEAIHEALAKYRSMLTRVEDGKVNPGAVHVIVSGNRDKETIAKSNPRYVGIDGRLSDLDTDMPSHLMPMISDNWRSHFHWRGGADTTISDDDKAKLTESITKAHAAGRRVRFWATPESETLWEELHAAGADAINTDELAKLESFLRAKAE